MKIANSLKRKNIYVIIFAAIVAFIATIRFHFFPLAQFIILSSLVLFYLGWAIIFHFFDKTLKLEILLEYILTATLALIFFYGVFI